jgi:hypothetical protein
MGNAVRSADFSVLRIATDFGTSSPITIWRNDTRRYARAMEML